MSFLKENTRGGLPFSESRRAISTERSPSPANNPIVSSKELTAYLSAILTKYPAMMRKTRFGAQAAMMGGR